MAQKKVRSCIVFGRRMACARVSQIDPVFPCHPPSPVHALSQTGVQQLITFVFWTQNKLNQIMDEL